jgi:ABC-type transport system involved in multi-copper enzyme maturation permease subunit
MIDQLASELLKIRSTRTVLWFLLVGVALALFGSVAQGLSPTLAKLATEDAQRSMFAGGASTGVLLATFVGLLLVTGEFRYGTIRPTLLFEPRRRVVLAAKLAASALVGVVFGAVCLVLAFAASLTVLSVRDVDLALSGGQLSAIAVGVVVTTALSAMLGVTTGALIRNQVGAIVAMAVYSLAIDALLFATAPSVGRFLPGQAGNALSGMPGEDLLTPGAGALALVAWAVAFIAAATARSDRRDV